MNTKVLIFLMASLAGLLTACATAPAVPGVDIPSFIKTEGYYKANYKDVVAKAESGDAEAQYELAYLYNGSMMGKSDKKKASYWLDKSAAQEYLLAMIVKSIRLHYHYSEYGYAKDDVLSSQLVDRSYEIFVSKPISDWSSFEVYMMADALVLRTYRMSNKEDMYRDVCIANRMNVTKRGFINILNEQKGKIGRACE